MTGKCITGIWAGILLLMCVASGAEGQLPKRGSYSAHYGHHTVVKVTELEKDHAFVIGENIGTVFNDAGQGFLHAAAVVCQIVADRVKAVSNVHGYCTTTDADGDKAFLVYKCRNPQVGVARCEGDFQWTGGTGKYTGLTGNNTFYGAGVPKTASGYSVWKGEWRLPD